MVTSSSIEEPAEGGAPSAGPSMPGSAASEPVAVPAEPRGPGGRPGQNHVPATMGWGVPSRRWEVVLVHRYLVVANQTLGGEPLFARIRELARAGPSAFYVVVPATPPKDHVWTEEEATEIARSRLDSALERKAALGLEADGEVGDGSPMLAVEDAIRDQGAFDAIVLPTLPPRL